MIDQAWLHLLEQGEIDERMVETASEPAAAAEVVELPPRLAPGLAAALRGAGIPSLYSHQLEALRRRRKGT